MMAKIKEKPFLLLLLFACVFLILGFIPSEKTSTIDLQLHDSYWVFRQNDIFIAGCFFFYFLFGLYLLFQRILFSNRLIWMHVSTTIVFTLALFLTIKTINFFTPIIPRRYYTYNEIESFAQYSFLNDIITILALVLFFSQFLFLINIIIGIVKKSNKSQ